MVYLAVVYMVGHWATWAYLVSKMSGHQLNDRDMWLATWLVSWIWPAYWIWREK